MTARSKTVIKSYFERGDKPTQAQFADLIDSYLDSSSAGATGLNVLGSVTQSSALNALGIGAVTGGFVKVTNSDTTVDVLNNKVSAANGLTKTILNVSAAEVLQISPTYATTAQAIAGSSLITIMNPSTTKSAIENAVSTQGNGLVLLQSQTASAAVTSIDFTANINGTYDAYVFSFDKIYGTSLNDTFAFQVSPDAGVTWRNTAGDYILIRSSYNQNSLPYSNEYRNGDDYFRMTTNVDVIGSPRAVDGQLWMYHPTDPVRTNFEGRVFHIDGNGFLNNSEFYGQANRNESINAVRFLCPSGTILGSVRLYGMKKS